LVLVLVVGAADEAVDLPLPLALSVEVADELGWAEGLLLALGALVGAVALAAVSGPTPGPLGLLSSQPITAKSAIPIATTASSGMVVWFLMATWIELRLDAPTYRSVQA